MKLELKRNYENSLQEKRGLDLLFLKGGFQNPNLKSDLDADFVWSKSGNLDLV